jgi:hypothetical protein
MAKSLSARRTVECGKGVVIGGEIIFHKCLIIFGKDIQANSKKLLVFCSLEQNIAVFKVFITEPLFFVRY